MSQLQYFTQYTIFITCILYYMIGIILEGESRMNVTLNINNVFSKLFHITYIHDKIIYLSTYLSIYTKRDTSFITSYLYLCIYIFAREYGIDTRPIRYCIRVLVDDFVSSAFSSRSLFPVLVTIKDRSHVPAGPLSIVRRSSRVGRFSHKTHGTTFDRRQSAIIIRVPGDLLRRRGPIRSSRSR